MNNAGGWGGVVLCLPLLLGCATCSHASAGRLSGGQSRMCRLSSASAAAPVPVITCKPAHVLLLPTAINKQEVIQHAAGVVESTRQEFSFPKH